MPRYLVQRSWPAGLAIPTNAEGAKSCLGVVDNNAAQGVTWVTSYVASDKSLTYCIYDGPDPESVRKAADINKMNVDRITEVRVLDPYFYHHH